MLFLHAQSIFGDAPQAEDTDLDVVALGYPLQRAYELWQAWEKGVMPRGGGYEDQPLRWRNMIRLMNRRFNRVYERAKAEHDPEAQREKQERDALDELMNVRGGLEGGALTGWDQFAGKLE